MKRHMVHAVLSGSCVLWIPFSSRTVAVFFAVLFFVLHVAREAHIAVVLVGVELDKQLIAKLRKSVELRDSIIAAKNWLDDLK